jgi:hypothetical protein
MAITLLDWSAAMAKGEGDMKRLLCSTLLAAAAALAGCDQSDHNLTETEPYDPQANVANAQVALPPAITAQKAYRCKDNSLIYVDWYSDGSARVKNARNEAGTQVPAPAAPTEGNATATAPSPLGGTADSASITYNGKTCHV